MLTVGIILLVVGALVALAAGGEIGRDRIVRFLGIGVAVIGLVLIVLAVLPADADAAAAMGLFGVPFLRRRRPAQHRIDPDFALALAAQVATGIARNPEPSGPGAPDWAGEMEQASSRARSALATIGIMLLNASDDPAVQETLRTDVSVSADHGQSTLRLTAAPRGTFAG